MSALHPGGLRLTARAARLADLKPGMRVLDVGGGDGDGVDLLIREFGANACGVDVFESPHPRVTLGDAARLPFGDGEFDAAMLECTLSVVADAETALWEARRVLRPGGRLILSDIYAKSEGEDGIFTLTELRELLARAGFALDREEEHTPALVTFAAELRALSPEARSRAFPCGIAARGLGYALLICSAR